VNARMIFWGSFAVMASVAATNPAAAQARSVPDGAGGSEKTSCGQLARLAFPDAKITLAEQTPARAFSVPGPAAGFGPNSLDLPAFCRVAATLTPTADSEIKMELWLPQNWNGKFMMVGNGAWSGSISYSAMAEPLIRGYAVASTDTGHDGGRGTFGFGHREKLVDFAWRAVHETVVKGKTLTAAYYGGKPRLSYWDGCSSGGKQGLKEVQMFPADFDGVIAGAPANNWMRLQVQSMVASLANNPKGRPPILGPAQIAILHAGVLAQCDGLDGVKDGEIADPRACRFRAASLVCKPGQAASTCLTPEQAAVANRLYAPVRDPGTKALIYPGMTPGSEAQWPIVIMSPWTVGIDTFALAHGDPNWDHHGFDPVQDLALAEKTDVGIAATNPDISAFKARGGKLIQYHGWADPLIPPENSINYYETVVARQGSLTNTEDFYRLFLIPGMGHCAGAYGVDWITALEQWVEANHAPDLLPGRRLPPMTFGPRAFGTSASARDLGARPICAYPRAAAYKGSGGGDEPANFSCLMEPRGPRSEDRP
jgi:feruloyl esterase